MFNKRDEVPSATPPPAPRPMQGGPAPVQNAPATPAFGRETPRESTLGSAAAIGTSMIIKGEIISREELYVDGEVEGKVELQQRLTVGPRGKVRANIKAREVIVLGDVKGNVEVTDKITIQKNGSVIGDIKAAGIVIDDGAYFKGNIDIVKSPPIKKIEAVKTAQAS